MRMSIVRLGVMAMAVLGALPSSADEKTWQPSFAADTTFGQASLAVSFTDTSVANPGEISAWSWDFGDGSALDTRQNPTHTYTVPGDFTVAMTATRLGNPVTVSKLKYIHVANPSNLATGVVDLTNAVVVKRTGTLPKSEQKASVVLTEEIQKRTGLSWSVTTAWPSSGTVIALTSQAGTGIGAEGYHLFVEAGGTGPTVVWVIGADARGVLYGVGKLLRSATWSSGAVTLSPAPNVTTAPAYSLRGHQIGYTNTNNSCDGWTAAQYEQYIREMVVFGANAVENSPLDTSTSPHFLTTQAQMNHDISAICDDYGIAYWVWTAAAVDLGNPSLRATELAKHQALYANCVRLDGVFVPGGDPGSNSPDVLLPFLHDLHDALVTVHPNAGVWVSNQQFSAAYNTTFFNYLQTNQPDWIAGVVYGPWTWMTLEEERNRTPSKYPIRHYPDITHSVRCQYPVPEWDRALAHTLNREAPNPRPQDEAVIHNRYAPFTEGFIAYSEGTHDDVNKQVWTMRGWDPNLGVDTILGDYCRFFFGASVSANATAGILGLEQDWVGPLVANADVDTTFTQWTQLETANPGLANNWRWQFFLLRAYYDKYIKARLANETSLEAQANVALLDAPVRGSATAIADARALLAHATSAPVRTDLRTRIVDLCLALYQSISYQSSIGAPYLASGLERSCVLDLVDWPVNNRYWMEAKMTSILTSSGSESTKAGLCQALVNYEDPGLGGFYDDLGNPSKQAHLIQQNTWADDPGYVESTQDEFLWHAGNTTSPTQGAARLSWQDQAQTLYGEPLHLRYTGLKPGYEYTVTATVFGRFNSVLNTKADGVFLGSNDASSELNYTLPVSMTSDGVLDLTWELVSGRGCQVAEVWLKSSDSQYTDIDKSGVTDAVDVQLVVNAALGLSTGGRNADVDHSGGVDAVDVQQVINGALDLWGTTAAR